jgi:hypothetical protein
LLIDILPDYERTLEIIPPQGMLYYLQFESTLRGRRHQNTFFCSIKNGDRSVFDFFRDQQLNIGLKLAAMQSWEVFQIGFLFVKLFPPPYVVMFIPTAYFGLWLEPAAPNKASAIFSYETVQSGRKRWGRKLLFGMPASWIDGDRLTPEGWLRMAGHTSTWGQLFADTNEESQYSMGKMNRYINHQYHSPLNPINYWPLNRYYMRNYLVKHRHAKRSQRWPNLT